MNRITREQMMLEVAHIAAKRGTCGRLAVGAVIARDARPISFGYVGAPPSEPHCDEANCDLTQPCTRTWHAERNAIKYARDRLIDIAGADLYTTDSPCANCCGWIIAAKIKRVYFERRYRDDTLEMLLDAGIEVYNILPNGMLNRIVLLDDDYRSDPVNQPENIR
jgi:dCMP deaminase